MTMGLTIILVILSPFIIGWLILSPHRVYPVVIITELYVIAMITDGYGNSNQEPGGVFLIFLTGIVVMILSCKKIASNIQSEEHDRKIREMEALPTEGISPLLEEMSERGKKLLRPYAPGSYGIKIFRAKLASSWDDYCNMLCSAYERSKINEAKRAFLIWVSAMLGINDITWEDVLNTYTTNGTHIDVDINDTSNKSENLNRIPLALREMFKRADNVEVEEIRPSLLEATEEFSQNVTSKIAADILFWTCALLKKEGFDIKNFNWKL